MPQTQNALIKKLTLFVACIICFVFASASAFASDLPPNPPDAWWWYYGQSPAQVTTLLTNDNARLMSIQVEQTSPLLFTVAMVKNSGAYAKQWWWYYGQTEADLTAKAKSLN